MIVTSGQWIAAESVGTKRAAPNATIGIMHHEKPLCIFNAGRNTDVNAQPFRSPGGRESPAAVY